jgi:hypothetical protein
MLVANIPYGNPNRVATLDEMRTIASVSWNDRWYESPQCVECGESEAAYTLDELKIKMAEHAHRY